MQYSVRGLSAGPLGPGGWKAPPREPTTRLNTVPPCVEGGERTFGLTLRAPCLRNWSMRRPKICQPLFADLQIVLRRIRPDSPPKLPALTRHTTHAMIFLERAAPFGQQEAASWRCPGGVGRALSSSQRPLREDARAGRVGGQRERSGLWGDRKPPTFYWSSWRKLARRRVCAQMNRDG